ncbi:MAG: methyltransferase domain-containing protein, partial [Gammaproteobacteria bacterium]
IEPHPEQSVSLVDQRLKDSLDNLKELQKPETKIDKFDKKQCVYKYNVTTHPPAPTARNFNDDCKYIVGDLERIELKKKFDVIHSMEVLYYIDKPADLLEKIAKFWLAENGRLIVGIDRYFENQESHSWDTDVGTKMHLKSEYEWVEMFKAAGFKQVSSWRANVNDSWAGTLVISAN